MLGRDIGNVYSREELKRLIDIHVMDPDAQAESGLTHADQRLIIGALDYKNKRYLVISFPIQEPSNFILHLEASMLSLMTCQQETLHWLPFIASTPYPVPARTLSSLAGV